MTAESRTITPRALTPEAFAPYGDVMMVETTAKHFEINEGHTTRFHDLARLDLERDGGHPLLSIFRSQPKALPLILEVMERHPLGSQAFYPLSPRPYLVVVAPPGDFDPAAVVAFLVRPDQGVNYHAGTWHHYSLALDETSDFLVIDRGGPGDNLAEVRLSPPIRIDLEGGAS
ncbi:ureidoglycolate lyase [Iodidimonas nitroreducens]|uniref:Ureidoglycolate lyase n=1 Tax=Iodidimonas nitroreducens TaxID=1236968 RepID=A0A5A7N5E6_9PROT|nr:ureidoglycolate lyase [Iodidimonas nitroreducens]GAK34312.1 ureidoglycolate lyase [alpha proteobacterium Q-1]GER03543.1 ureidoglycolate lyase [Iodidimonas nitroreducens]